MEHPRLTREKILEILRKVEGGADDIELIDFSLKPGAGKGDNFAGVLIACDVRFKAGGIAKEHHWMIKLTPDASSRLVFSKGMHVEEKEISMYTKIIPAFERIVRERKADIKFNFCPAPFAEFDKEDETASILVMENLLHLGYSEAVNKKKGLNIHYAKSALAEMAKFHAVGYAYIKSYPGGIEEGLRENYVITRDYFMSDCENSVKELFQSFKPMMVESVTDLLESVQEPGQDFARAFMEFHKKHDCIEFRDKLCRPKANGFNTFCHGDAWFNNLMFYHEKNREEGSESVPTKAALIDLAMTRWSSPATDLAYFLYLSVTPQLRKTHLDDLLGHYHDTLVRCLHKLGEDPAIYPYRELRKDYDRCSFTGLLVSFMLLPTILCKKEDAMNPDDFGGDLDMDDKEKLAELMKKGKERTKTAFRNEPQIKIVVGGNFLEAVELGFFKL